MDLDEAIFGDHPVALPRLFALVRYISGEGALYAATHDEKGEPTYAPSQPAGMRTVTTLRGLDLAALYSVSEN